MKFRRFRFFFFSFLAIFRFSAISQIMETQPLCHDGVVALSTEANNIGDVGEVSYCLANPSLAFTPLK